ncbi:MAG: FAD-dependent oxidoreductase [Planctomycetota bacterium]
MSDVVVVGAGIVGLCAAAVLRERGHAVAVWAKDDPADTVSAVAGAIWYPFLAEPRERVLGWGAATFRRLAVFAQDPASGVRMQRVVEVFATAEPDLWLASASGPITRLPRERVPAGYAAAIELDVPVCDVPIHLPWLRGQLLARGVRFEQRTVRSFAEAFAQARIVVNCTGLGAAELCGDRQLQPVRGQVIVVERRDVPHALIDDTAAQPFYVIPRRDDVVLGGTAQPGDTRLAADVADTRAILDGIAARMPCLLGAAIRAVKVGLRPYRSTVRVEAERRPDGGLLVHDYGHGGSGYTLAWGCAEEVAALVGPAG